MLFKHHPNGRIIWRKWICLHHLVSPTWELYTVRIEEEVPLFFFDSSSQAYTSYPLLYLYIYIHGKFQHGPPNPSLPIYMHIYAHILRILYYCHVWIIFSLIICQDMVYGGINRLCPPPPEGSAIWRRPCYSSHTYIERRHVYEWTYFFNLSPQIISCYKAVTLPQKFVHSLSFSYAPVLFSSSFNWFQVLSLTQVCVCWTCICRSRLRCNPRGDVA